jgi:hypothetical protein
MIVPSLESTCAFVSKRVGTSQTGNSTENAT